jgi:universal stress protein E
MNRFHSILFVSHGIAEEKEALKQALSLARNNKALLHALIVCPALPKEMEEYTDKYKAALKEQLQTSLQAARDSIKVTDRELLVEIAVESGSTPAIRIVRHVLKQAHDLVIKEAQPVEAGKGFQAIDMELLRKCPVPVWLTRPIQQHLGSRSAQSSGRSGTSGARSKNFRYSAYASSARLA